MMGVFAWLGVFSALDFGPGGGFLLEEDGNLRYTEVFITINLIEFFLGAVNSLQAFSFPHAGERPDFSYLESLRHVSMHYIGVWMGVAALTAALRRLRLESSVNCLTGGVSPW